MLLSLLPSILLGFTLMFLTPAILGNSLGKFIFGIKIAPLNEDKLTIVHCLLRMIPLDIWPVNLIMIMFKDRQHLGDKIAKTHVVNSEPKRNLLLAFPAAIVSVVVLFNMGLTGLKVGTVNHAAVKTAKEAYGDNVSFLPAAVNINRNNAVIDLQVGEDYKRIELRKSGEGWTITNERNISSPASGFSINY